MDDIEAAISRAWFEVEGRLVGEELERRLRRRGSKMLGRPLRAWCAGVRANDRRIGEEREVVLTKELVVRLSEPVEILRPGEPADEVAKRMGCSPRRLVALRRSGWLRTTPKPGLRGRRGQPVPLVYSAEHLHPQAQGRMIPDEVFSSCWRDPPGMLAEDFSQVVERVPRYMPWKDGERFEGWYWACPRCGRMARVLYCPVDQPDFPTWIGFAPARERPLPRPEKVFACRECHGVIGFSRAQLVTDWNLLIGRYTGGLLYGHEVEMPAWLESGRKREYCRKPRRAPRREQVEKLLVETEWTLGRIAEELGVRFGAVACAASRAYRRRGVKGRSELKERLGRKEMRVAG